MYECVYGSMHVCVFAYMKNHFFLVYITLKKRTTANSHFQVDQFLFCTCIMLHARLSVKINACNTFAHIPTDTCIQSFMASFSDEDWFARVTWTTRSGQNAGLETQCMLGSNAAERQDALCGTHSLSASCLRSPLVTTPPKCQSLQTLPPP